MGLDMVAARRPVMRNNNRLVPRFEESGTTTTSDVFDAHGSISLTDAGETLMKKLGVVSAVVRAPVQHIQHNIAP